MPPAPAFGDSIGAITIAGAIMGALFHRERTGHATVVDVSLLATGMWSMGGAMALSLAMNFPWTAPPADRPVSNPLTRNYRTSDGRTLAFTCLQAGQYWPSLCDIIERPELKDDPRFTDAALLMQNSREAIAILDDVFAERDARRVARAPRVVCGPVGRRPGHPRGRRRSADRGQRLPPAVRDRRRGTPFRLVGVPMQYDDEPAVSCRAPEFNEHGDAILESIGLDMEQIIDLKIRNVVA